MIHPGIKSLPADSNYFDNIKRNFPISIFLPQTTQIRLQLNCLCIISGLIALIFSCWSKAIVARDWDGALLRGKIAFGFAVTGIVVTVIAVLAFVLIFYTRDTQGE